MFDESLCLWGDHDGTHSAAERILQPLTATYHLFLGKSLRSWYCSETLRPSWVVRALGSLQLSGSGHRLRPEWEAERVLPTLLRVEVCTALQMGSLSWAVVVCRTGLASGLALLAEAAFTFTVMSSDESEVLF